MTKEQMIDWINNASYQELLQKWRFAPSGSEWFQGEIGAYYSKVMFAKRDQVGPAEATRASKNIGWEK